MSRPATRMAAAGVLVAAMLAATGCRLDVKRDVDPAAKVFQGTIPCADCPGIDLTVSLYADSTFALEQVYQDRDPSSTWRDAGSWVDEGGVLVLQGGGENPMRFTRFGDDSLTMLDSGGEPIESGLNYTLRRVVGEGG